MFTTQALEGLRSLLEGWGIKADDWYVTGEAAMVLSGYPVEYREGQIDILVCRNTWPWAREEEQVSLFPDKGTLEDRQLHDYISKFNITPDFHPLPHVGIKAEDRFEQTYWLTDEKGVRVLKPWAGVYHRECIINFYTNEHPKGLNVFDQVKFIRWKKFIEQIREHAFNIKDEQTSAMCDEVLPLVQQAIEFFENKTPSSPLTRGSSTATEDPLAKGKAELSSRGNKGGLTGTPVYQGKATGPAQHWQDGADFKGKIAILTHILPSQVTLIKEAAGIVTDQGGLLSHAATVAREYKIPTVIGTRNATSLFEDGDELEVDAVEGIVRRSLV